MSFAAYGLVAVHRSLLCRDICIDLAYFHPKSQGKVIVLQTTDWEYLVAIEEYCSNIDSLNLRNIVIGLYGNVRDQDGKRMDESS